MDINEVKIWVLRPNKAVKSVYAYRTMTSKI